VTTFHLESDRLAENLAGNTLEQFDPNAPIEHDPYPDYARYRAEDAIHWGKPHDPRLPGMWYLFRHPHVQQLFRLGIGASAPIGGMPSKLGWDFAADVPEGAVDYFELRKRFLTAQDPPDHTRVRGVIGSFFTPKNIEGFRPRIEQMVSAMLDEMEPLSPGDVDICEVLASPLPLLVVSEVMGVPFDDREYVHQMSQGLGAGFDVDGTFDRLLVAGEAARGFRAYLKDLFEEQRRDPENNVISGMIAASEGDGKLNELDLYATVSVLIQGGHSTTMGLLGRGLQGLLQQRDQWELLCSDPEGLASSAAEELLRWTSPAQRPPPRWVYEDIEIDGHTFRRGEVIEPMIASANRDEDVFPDPDRIDITRAPNPHLAFGGGVHRCVGSSLARLEGQVVFKELARRYPNLDLDGDPSHHETYMDRKSVRALSSLPLVLR
jgi:cytochrome P450 StaP